ncbi:MAG: hypothetical protein ACFBQW_02235 [Sphingomonadaceae bacterium]
MRKYVAAMAAMAMPAALAAQAVAPGNEVDRVSLSPGDAVLFAIVEGEDHQILKVRAEGEAARNAALRDGEIRLAFSYDGKQSKLLMENGLGYPVTFDTLADRSGNGGFKGLGEATVPADANGVVGTWTFPIATLNVGHFEQAPHGKRKHP